MSALEVDVTEQDVLIREVAPAVRIVAGIEIDGLERYGRNILARLEDNGCWTWLRYIDPHGYGRTGRTRLAHRVVYELVRGPIPEGLVIDHLCQNRACVNPNHLEAVALEENSRRSGARKTRCLHGHDYTADNTYIDNRGARSCRTCRKRAAREYVAKRRLTA